MRQKLFINGNERTGDSWQNYAWRWALCHLLETNPNYTKKFRPLGLGMLMKQPVSFEQTYGDVADQIYKQACISAGTGWRK